MQTSQPVTKPSKQRKILFQAPDHKRYKFFAAPLSPELQASQKVKALPVRTGDTVRVLRGDHKGLEGKITRINRAKYRVYLEGLTREKVDGTSLFVPVHPSKVMITNLNLDDKWRKEIIKRKVETRKRIEKAAEKPSKEIAETKEEIIEEKIVAEKKPQEKKPRKRKRKVAKKATRKETAEKTLTKTEEKPKAKKAPSKRSTRKKSEGGT